MLVLLLLLPVAYFFAFDNRNHVEVSKVVDPFLFRRAHSWNASDTDMVTMLVTSPGPLGPSQRTRLAALGMITGSIGRVTTVRLPSHRIERIVGLDFVSGVYSPRSYRPALDVSASEIGAVFVWQNVTDPHGKPVDGAGVVIGIIDTGVDLSHPDLKFPNGTSKVLYLWDQTASEKPPQGFTYGVECSWHEINGGKCLENDTFGHGTHVASIAASSGLASDKYRGIAPGASLIVVKTGRESCGGESWVFEDTAVIDGLRYVVERARALGMRLVVNLSLGGNIGGHDGTSPLEVVLDDLSAQDVIVTVSAGNEADNHIHANGSLSRASPTRINWEPIGQAKSAMVDLWYPKDRSISVALVTPSGEVVPGPTSASGTETSNGLVTIVPATTAKGNELAFSVQTQGSLTTHGWGLILNVIDDGFPLSWDAWVDSDSCSSPAASFSSGQGYEISEAGTVSVPATSSGAIAVGAYVTKNSWGTGSGKNVLTHDYHVGDIAPFSSRGPTRDGRTKPDISAPGLFVTAARSLHVLASDSDPDHHHRVLAGTSMAAPHVAGVVALMLQYSPHLGSRELRSLLVEGANLDNFTGLIEASKGSNEWGWGKVDARTATSLFRVSSTVPSLPAIFAVNFAVDGEPHGVLKVGEVVTLRFLSGGAHLFRVTGQTFTANATRYVVAEDHATFSSNGVFKPSVRVQYLLSLESALGQTDGEGWYEAGSHAGFTVNPPETSKGLGQLLGVTFFLDHWVDEQGNLLSSGSVLMDSPHTLRASWRARLTDLRPALLLLALVVVLMLVLEFRRGNLRRRQSAGLRTGGSVTE
ncbi:S8 family peptidase [[Eubacterium] cellulosolvens]